MSRDTELVEFHIVPFLLTREQAAISAALGLVLVQFFAQQIIASVEKFEAHELPPSRVAQTIINAMNASAVEMFEPVLNDALALLKQHQPDEDDFEAGCQTRH